MPGATAYVGGGWAGMTPAFQDCLTDTFTRTVPNFEGGYYDTPSGWGISDAGIAWSGSSVATFVNGSEGVLGIYSADEGYNPPAPSWALPDWQDANVWGQQTYLNWPMDITPMDITFEMYLNRALALNDYGHQRDTDYWGDYFTIYIGDGPPFGDGKTTITFFGNGQYAGYQPVFVSPYDDGALGSFTNSAIVNMSIDLTAPFKVRIMCEGEAQYLRVWVWQASAGQPEDPTITWPGPGEGDVTYKSYSNHGLTIELSTDNDNLVTPLELHLKSLTVVGLDCFGCVIDDFSGRKTEAPASLGTTTSGHEYFEDCWWTWCAGGQMVAQFEGGSEDTGGAVLRAPWPDMFEWEYDVQFVDEPWGGGPHLAPLTSAYVEFGSAAIQFSDGASNLVLAIFGSGLVSSSVPRLDRASVAGRFEGAVYKVWVWPYGANRPTSPTDSVSNPESLFTGNIGFAHSGGAGSSGQGYTSVDNLRVCQILNGV